MRENKYQASIIRRLKREFPDSIVLKNDSSYIQGIPDLLILNYSKWACLEVKPSFDAPTEPNQPYYVDKLNNMSYASFIFPENEDQVFHELQFALNPSR